MKKLKIIIPVLGFGRSGGMRVLSNLATCFMQAGHETEFLAPKDNIEPYFPTQAPVKRYDYPFKRIPALRFYTKMVCMYLWLRKYSQMYDIVLANAYGTALPVELGTKNNAKGYYYIQAYEVDFANDVPFPFSILDIWLARRSYRLNLTRIVNSELYRNYKEIKSDNVVPPGVDLEVFKFEPRIWKGGTLEVGCVGRLEGWKGTQLIIDTVRNFRKLTGIDLRLNIAFNLPRGFVESEADNFINLMKPHGDVALAEFYRQNHLFIAIGLIQGGAYHYPCIESMASGTLVISNYSPLKQSSKLYINEASEALITSSLFVFCKMSEEDRVVERAINLSVVKELEWKVVSQKLLKILKNEDMIQCQ